MEYLTLAIARQRLSLSLREVAAELGVSRASVSRWERGLAKPQPTLLRKLCTLYGISPRDLQETPLEEIVPTSATPDALKLFQQGDLTMRLISMVVSAKKNHYGLQQQIMLQLVPPKEETMQEALSRRNALRRIAAMPMTLGLTFSLASSASRIDETINHCAAGTTACVALSKQKELAFVSSTLGQYIPALTEIVKTGNTAQQQAAADVLTQCLLLLSIQAKHVTGNADAIKYAQMAEKYGVLAKNPLLQIVALRAFAGASYYDGNYRQALQADLKAQQILREAKSSNKIYIPPIIISYIEAGLAREQAVQGQRKEALSALQQAHTTFYMQPSNEPLPNWLHHNLTSLNLVDGTTHLHLNQSKEAAQAFTQVTNIPVASAASKVEATINLVMVELIRDDRERDIEYCITKWTEGIEGAKTLKSQQWFTESVQAYTAIRAAWPTEPRVKALKELIVHW